MKKFISFICVITLVFIFLTACSDNTVKDDGRNGNNELKKDFNEQQFTILQISSIADVLGYKENTELCDIVIQRLADVGKENNCKILLEAITDDSQYKMTMKNAIAANDYICDINFANPFFLRDSGNAGGLVPMEDVSEFIDVNDYEKWSNPNVQEMIMCQGVLYGVVPALWVNMFTPVYYNIAINEELVRVSGQTDPREYVEQKVWTRDKLIETVVGLSQLTVEPKIFGMSAEASHIIRAAVMGNDVKMAMVENGKVKSGWDSEGAVEALTWLRGVVENYGDYFFNRAKVADGNPWDVYGKPFYEDKVAVMYLTSSDKILEHVIYKVEDFGLVPFPAGPHSEYGKWPGFYESATVVSIPTFAEDWDASAYLINEIFRPFSEYPDKASIMNYYITNVFHDPRDVESLFSLGDTSQYYYWPNGGDNLIYSLGNVIHGKGSISQALKTNINLVQKCLDEQVMPNWIAMDKNGMGVYANTELDK